MTSLRTTFLGTRTRRVAWFVGVLVAALFAWRCAPDPITSTGAGAVHLAFRSLEDPALDSLRVRVVDGGGSLLAGPVSLGASTEPVTLELEVRAGEDRAVEIRGEGVGPTPEGGVERGIVAEGRSARFEVRRGETVAADVRLASRIPRLHPVVAAPGDLSFVVRWDRVAGALDYRLAEERRGVVTVYTQSDTSRNFELRPFDPTRYRVRARLVSGFTVYSDSIEVVPGSLSDLPRVLSIQPLDGAIEVSDTVEPTLIFDRPIDWASVDETSVRLEPASGGAAVALERDPDGPQTLRLLPAAPLVRGATYAIVVTTSVRDLDGRPLDQDPDAAGLQGFRSEFTLEVYDPIRVIAVTPPDGAGPVEPQATIRVTFDRAADPATLIAGNLRLTDSLGVDTPRSIAISEGGTQVTLTPLAPMAFVTRYRVEVTAGVRDAVRGEPLDQNPATPQFEPFTSSFRVGAQPPGPSVASVSPPDLAPSAPVFESIRIRFASDVDPSTVTAATFNVRRLPLGAIIPGTVTAGANPREFLFVTTAMERDTRYRVVVTPGVLDLQGNPLDQDRATPGLQEFSSTFRTERNPQVVSVQPADGSLRVPRTTPIRVRFSIPVLPSSVTDSSFVLSKGGIVVPATRVVASDSVNAVLTPLAPLEPFGLYRVFVTPGVKTRRGSSLDQDLARLRRQAFESRFTTQAESIPPRVIFVEPPSGATEVGPRPVIRVRFDQPVLPASINPTTFLVRALPSGSELAGALSLTPDSLEASFQLAADLAPQTEHEVRVTNWVQNRFDVRLDQDPILAERQDFISRFTTAQEQIPPRVVSVEPGDLAEEVAATAFVRVRFTESMAKSPLLESAFRLSLKGTQIAGGATLGDDGSLLTFTPAAPLLAGRWYDVFVDTLATDLHGNLLDDDGAPSPRLAFRSRFRIAPDREGPRVISSWPANGSEQVKLVLQPEFRFSEPLDPSSVTPSAFSLVDSLGGVVLVQTAMFFAPDSVALTLADSLLASMRYTLSAEPSLSDTLGNPLDQDPGLVGDQPFTATFKTQRETQRPRVRGLFLDGAPTPVDTRLRIAMSEPIDPTSVGPATVRLTKAGLEIATTLSLSAPDTVLVLPNELLDYETEYVIAVAGLADTVGNLMDQDPATPERDPFLATFITGVDTTPPFVVSTAPPDSASGLHPTAFVQVVFSERMDPATVTVSNLQLRRIPGGQILDGVIIADPDGKRFEHHPDSPLEEGATYEIRATFFLTDTQGIALDQDPETPTADPFVSVFSVGFRPIANAGPPLCDPADSVRVVIDASGSFDPDGQIVSVTWNWGDGAIETLEAPAGLTVEHSYFCLDLNGCNGIDDDSDGATDEVGTFGCDESHRITLLVEDNDGATAVDTIGVSFCAFLAISSEPGNGAVDVDTLTTAIRVHLSRAVDPATLDPGDFALTGAGDVPVPGSVFVEDGGKTLTFTPAGPLAPSTLHTIKLGPALSSLFGPGFDQAPCVAGSSPYAAVFTTRGPPPP